MRGLAGEMEVDVGGGTKAGSIGAQRGEDEAAEVDNCDDDASDGNAGGGAEMGFTTVADEDEVGDGVKEDDPWAQVDGGAVRFTQDDKVVDGASCETEAEVSGWVKSSEKKILPV